MGGLNLYAADQRVVKVGAFNLYPAIFKDTDGAVKGFYVDALADIEQTENIRFEYVYGSWSKGLERIKTGEVDMLTSVAFTPERAEFLDYAKTPLLTVWGELYVPLSSDIDGILAVQGKKIAVMKNDFNARHFIELVKMFDITCEFIEMPAFEDVFKAIATGKADAGVVNNTFGVAKNKEFGLRSTGVVFNPFDIFFAVAKGKNSDLLLMLDSYLESWRYQTDSVYSNARQKWLHGSDNVIHVIPRWLMPTVAVISILALCAFAFIVILKKQVLSKTRSVVEASKRYQILSERQNAILSSVPDIMMEVDTNKIYTWANSAGLEFFGAEVCGKEASYYFAGDQNTYEVFQPLFDKSKDVLYVESLQRRKDGAVRLLAWWCKSLRDGQGNITGMLSTARDITERKQAEVEREKLQAQLLQAQKMESVGRLAGGVAHDFNNMLGVILGYTELALHGVGPDEPLHADLEKIQKAAKRSADLTRQLLAFARKQTVSPRVIDLNDTIDSMLKLLVRLIGEDIDLSWRPGKEVWPVKVDPVQIDLILANLCVNARDAITGVGKVTIETDKASFDEESCTRHAGFVPGDYVLLAVSDNGCGMDTETKSLLFEPFFTTKELGKGTGLGLATVYGVVKQNNGFINVYSEPGQGTTFNIYLPRHAAKTDLLPKQVPVLAMECGRETILLVEDEPAILEMTTRMLGRLGYTVLAAGTPGEAVRLAQERSGRIDLLMTDVVMPEMNGRDLAKKLLSIYPDIRRLFMSGYTANVIADHGVLDEGVHFIQKPFSLNELGVKLREALEA
jgi:PAS domain S-box-containing protein